MRAAAGSGAAASSRPTHGVSAVPGATALTRMPSAMPSAAIASVSACTAPFVALYAARSGSPAWPAVEPTLRRSPARRAVPSPPCRASGEAELLDRRRLHLRREARHRRRDVAPPLDPHRVHEVLVQVVRHLDDPSVHVAGHRDEIEHGQV